MHEGDCKCGKYSITPEMLNVCLVNTVLMHHIMEGSRSSGILYRIEKRHLASTVKGYHYG